MHDALDEWITEQDMQPGMLTEVKRRSNKQTTAVACVAIVVLIHSRLVIRPLFPAGHAQ